MASDMDPGVGPGGEMPDIRLDSGRLYREETYTDRRMGTLRKLVPVHADGSEDTARETLWEGSTSLLTPAGTLPLNFEIPADGFSEALEKFPAAAQEALERTMEELKELRRESASSIITPGSGADLGKFGAGSGGGLPRR
ncbi:MAG: hypothetical protein ACRESR_08380 [Gammaproteobacteria bacterium]